MILIKFNFCGRFLLATALLFFSFSACAYPSYFCDKTNRSVSVGDNMETVRANCGEPTAVETKNEQYTVPVNTEQWVYTVNATTKTGESVKLPATTLVFQDHILIQINKTGFPSARSVACGIAGLIQVGDRMESVRGVCGSPNQINRSQTYTTKTRSITVWTYNKGNYAPQILFDFSENRLIDIHSGVLGK